MARDWHEGREDWRRDRGEDDDRRREHRGESFSAREYDPERRMGPGRAYGSGEDWYRDRGDWRDRGGGRTRGSDDPAFRSQFERDFGSREFGTNQRGADSPFSNQRGGYDRGGYGGYLGRGTDENRWGAPEGMHLSGGGWDEDRGQGRDRGWGGYGRGEAGYGDRSGRGRSDFGRDYGYGGGMAAGDYRDYGDRSRRGGEGGYGDRQDRSWFERAADEVSSWFGGEDREGHRGRGPKGYRRSDSRIAEDVNDRLSDDHLLDASEIEVKVHNGEVTLTGTVDSRMAKRRAEDIAESVSGVNHCQNNLRITQTGRETGAGQTGIAGTGLGTGSGTSAAGPQGGQVGSTMSPPSATGSGAGTGAGTAGQDPNRPRH